MPKKHRPRRGSLQFWPRKRAEKYLDSANWASIGKSQYEKKEGLLGFVGYKIGMLSAIARDLTQNSLTANQEVVIPVTFLECPPMKLYSIRFYKDNRVKTEINVVDNKSKDARDLKKKVKISRQVDLEKLNKINLSDVQDIRLLLHTQPKLAAIKKKPDMIEIAINSQSVEKKLEVAKSFVGKEINLSDVFNSLDIVDIKGVTKGKGFQGVVKRFGVGLRRHKSEKGTRRVGSIGSWTPKKLTFQAPMAGQLGFFNRTQHNNLILQVGSKQDAAKINPAGGFNNYGILKNQYAVIKGSVQGSQKRPLLLTFPSRSKKTQYKFEVIKFG